CYCAALSHSTLHFLDFSGASRQPHAFPTRRSSDLFNLEALLRFVAREPERIAELHDALARYEQATSEFSGEAGKAFDDLRQSLRSEEHTSELQSRENLVCRLLLEKKKHRRNNTSSK